MYQPGQRTTFSLLALALAVQGALALWFVLTPAAGDAAFCGFPLDDAWIHMVYARSMAEHGLPLYGDRLEAGFSGPLWPLVLTLAQLAGTATGLGAVLFAKLAGVLAATATSAVLGVAVLRLGGSRAAAAAATLLCAANPVLAFAQVSGMEVAVTTACAVFAVAELARARHARAGVWLALAYLARPECALLAPLLAVVPFADAAMPLRARWRSAAGLLLPLGVAVIAWAGYCLCATGHPLPNTFYAKFAFAADGSPWAGALTTLARLPSNWLGAGAMLALAAPWAGQATTRWLRGVVLVFPLLFAFAIACTRPGTVGNGEYFFFARYAAPAWPFVAAALALGADVLLRTAPTLRQPALRGFAVAVPAALLLLAMAPHPRALAVAAQRYAQNCQNIEEVQVAFGRWVAANVPADRAVAVNDAGAIRYFGARHCIDLLGLNDATVLFAQPPLAQVAQDADAMADWLLQRRVEQLVVFPSWFDGLLRQPRFAARFVESQRFCSADYTIADPRSGQATMVAYRVLPANVAAPGR